MSYGPKPSLELINAVRRCAEAQMSYAETADELTTHIHPLNRSAIAGIAYRNGIAFTKKKSTNVARKPKDRRTIRKALPATLSITPTFGSIARNVRAPGAACSWLGCTSHAVEGDMFCYQHYKKQLVS